MEGMGHVDVERTRGRAQSSVFLLLLLLLAVRERRVSHQCRHSLVAGARAPPLIVERRGGGRVRPAAVAKVVRVDDLQSRQIRR